MDNHKDFIHIDDVFKNLRNGEEPEGSGAWLRMKDLLDKELPVGTPIASGWSFRRYMLPLVALLLIGGGVTYYEMKDSGPGLLAGNTGMEHTVSGNAGGEAIKAVATHDPVAHASGNGIHDPKATGRNNGQSRSGSVKDGAAQAGHQPVSGAMSQHAATAGSGTAASGSNHALKNDRMPAAGEFIPANTIAKRSDRTHTPLLAKKALNITVAEDPAGKDQPVGITAGSKALSEEHVIEKIQPKNQGAAVLASGNKNNATAAKTGLPARTETNRPAEPQPGNGNLKAIATTLNNKKIVKDEDGNLYKEERDTFKRMDLVERTVAARNAGNSNTKQLKTILDTVAVTRIEKIRYVPLNPIELMALKKMSVDNRIQKPVPMASLRERTSTREEVSFVPLTNYKVASRRLDPGKFNQLVQNTTRGISNYFDGSRNFYLSLIVGGNASFGNPGAFGMQAGIAGLYSLGERLTLAAELKYVSHYFSNYTLQDQSITFDNVNSQQVANEWLFSGNSQTTTAVYKVNSFAALEMPVTLSYNLGRVSVFAGLNMAYAFPMNWKKELTVASASVQEKRAENQNPFIDAAFQLNEKKDFASRLGLGYVWGLNYDLSRKISLDARVGQILWDNSNSSTDALNRLFRIPTVQLSFSYFLGRKEKVVYIMDRR